MADLSPYMTPDGRRLQLPPVFAAQFAGLTPDAPPSGPPGLPPPGAIPAPPPGQAAPPIPGGEPAWTPDNTAALAAATPPPPMPTDGPVTSPDQMPPSTGTPVVPRGPVVTPAEDTGTSSLAKPPPAPGSAGAGPLTEQQLAKMGTAGAYNAQAGAIEEQKSAARRVGEAAADQMTLLGNLAAEAADAEGKKLEERRQIAEQVARDLEKKTNEYLTNAKALADTRIDRTIDHPVLTAIGLALQTIGGAMKGQSNEAAIKGVYDALDRKVAAQMQDLDMRAKGLAVQREGLDLQRLQGKDRLEQIDTYRLASIQQAARKIEAIKTQTSVPGVRAAADEVLAGLELKRTEVLGGAQERWQQQKNAEAARAQAAQFHKDTMTFQWAQLNEQREARAASLAEKLIDRKDAAGAAKIKTLTEQAIIDPSTGNYMLTPAGQAKMQQADAYEAKARQATDPAQAQRLNVAAQQLREDAQVNDAAIALNKKGAEEAQKAVAAAQETINKTDIARRALESDPSPANREAWASLQAQFTFLKAQAAKGLGERVSVRAMEALDEVLSIDAGSLWSRAADKGKAIAALNTIDREFAQSADVALKSAGIKSGWRPAQAAAAPSFEGRTAQEIADSSVGSGGIVGQISSAVQAAGGSVSNPLKDQAYESARARTGKLADGSPGRPSEYGLAPDTESTVDALIARANRSGHKEYADVLDALSGPLLKISGDKARPSLAKAVAEKLNDADHKLFEDVLASIANKPGGGKMKADEIRAALPKPPPEFTPVGGSALTPQLQSLAQGMSPADRAKLIEWARSNGFAGVAGGQ